MAGALEGSCLAFSNDGDGWALLFLATLPAIWRTRDWVLLLAAALFSEVEKRARPTAITGEYVVVIVVVSEPGARARKPSLVAASILNLFFFPSRATLAS